MTVTDQSPPIPRWLLRLTALSVTLAILALFALLWSRWGVVVAMAQDVMTYCS